MRYFSATAQGGHLYLSVFNGALIYRTADEIAAMFNSTQDRWVQSVVELDAILQESIGRLLPLGSLYLAEGLEDEARKRGPAESHPPISRSYVKGL